MEQLKQTDFRWHAEQPDVPGLSASEMKAFMDAPVHTLVNKVNEVIGEVEAVDLSTLRQELDKKADAAEHLLMFQGCWKSLNEQIKLLTELHNSLSAEIGLRERIDDRLQQELDTKADAEALNTEITALKNRDDTLSTEITALSNQSIKITNMILQSLSELGTQQDSHSTAINELSAQQASTAPVFIDHFDLTVEEINNIYTECILKGRALVIKENAGKYVCNQVYANGTGDQIAFIYIKCSSWGEVTFHRHGYVLESGAHYPTVYTLQTQV